MNEESFGDLTVERLAEALRYAEQKFLLAELSKLEFPAEEFRSFFLGLEKESDRALAVIAFSYIDCKLREAMIKAFNPEISGGVKSLFDPFGPLGTASACIELAGALFWIPKDVYAGLRTLRKIRNRFAHEPFNVGFDEPGIVALLDCFKSHKKILDWMRPNFSNVIPKRVFFHTAAVVISGTMIVDVATAPIAVRHGPEPMVRVDAERLPPAIQSFRKVVAEIILKLVRPFASIPAC